MLQRGYSGDGYDLASTLSKCDLFVLSWARVLRVRRVSILLLPLVARCLETIVCLGCGSVGGESVGGLRPGYGGVRWCYLCVNCESEFFV